MGDSAPGNRLHGNMVDDFQTLVDRLAAGLQQSVAVDDPEGSLLAISRHYGDEDGYRIKLVLERHAPPEYRDYFAAFVQGLVDCTAESPIRVPANPALNLVGRIGYSIRALDRLVAILWVIDRGVDLPRRMIEDYCAALGGIFTQRHTRQLARGSEFAGGSIRRLLAGAPVDEDDIARWLVEAQTEFRVLAACTEPGNTAAGETARAALQKVPAFFRRQGFSLACLARMDGFEVAVYGRAVRPAPGTPGQDEAVHHGGPELAGLPESAGAGLSGAADVVGLRRAYIESALTAFLVHHLHRRGEVLEASAMAGPAALLAIPLSTPEPPRVEALKALLSDPDGFAFETLGAMLHSDGSQASMTELLSIHRTTLHYRTTQIEQHTGLNLQAPADLFTAVNLWLRVAAARSGLGDLLAESQGLPAGGKAAAARLATR